MKREAVLLDVDGTLVDSNEFHVTAWLRAFSDAGISIASEKIRKQIGKGADMLIPTLTPDLPSSARKAVAKRHDEIFEVEFLPRVRAFPHARELIETLRDRDLQVVLASSAQRLARSAEWFLVDRPRSNSHGQRRAENSSPGNSAKIWDT